MIENKMVQTLNDPRSGLNNSQKKLAVANSVKSVAEQVLGGVYNYAVLIAALTDEKFNVNPKIRIVAKGDVSDYQVDEDGEDSVILSVNPKLLNLANLADFKVAVGAAMKKTQGLNPTEALRTTGTLITTYSNSLVMDYNEAKEDVRDQMFASLATNVFNYLRNYTPDVISNIADATVFKDTWVTAGKKYQHEENDVNGLVNRCTFALFEIIYGILAADARIFYGHYKTVAAATDRTQNGGIDIRTGTDEFITTYLMLCLRD